MIILTITLLGWLIEYGYFLIGWFWNLFIPFMDFQLNNKIQKITGGETMEENFVVRIYKEFWGGIADFAVDWFQFLFLSDAVLIWAPIYIVCYLFIWLKKRRKKEVE